MGERAWDGISRSLPSTRIIIIRSLVGARLRTDCFTVRPGGGSRIRVPSLVYGGVVTFHVRLLNVHARVSQRVLI